MCKTTITTHVCTHISLKTVCTQSEPCRRFEPEECVADEFFCDECRFEETKNHMPSVEDDGMESEEFAEESNEEEEENDEVGNEQFDFGLE
jgi:hypothetical protein